ncbi:MULTISPECIES: NADP-dependent succinate-semialdehyde dehydrogenase [unclassified Agrobacterium]|uniref:NADP-dependent succinate-semialdehyde dehydrogenase n=1 Tax=unclassified Agrobacterium TaxID=2632611 RepID=UPI0024475D3E|nr:MULTISPECIES: NADP-dependent succinate-semialdehyde dehydrogenase [unclassified Agrobacterium]MDH0614944.1 NADP-dependent succinate-semialdehyde dehydrogenase [Agrobacterium sp. GD03872]MDH0699512.1 NADP-dependent succinate-semialdehyde dehydrogenase [Agrobacterium sp. GD03871]MDH1062006.1 NADP-dependent succinate-semialdehyde dehydrogenase [Agrobacterium sp. GD03992]MDH2211714.1 NADP-dependent succinate-semialdehyde dehydrogenase [Agrobacterium sp. GD03643]MDH2220406.1 NADP-dependent succi
MTLKDPSLLRQAAFVGGEWIEANGAGIAVTNPATGDVIGYVPKLGAAETKKAIAVAERVQKEWAARTAKERAGILRKWFELMIANQDDLGHILTLEQGKPLAEAKGEIAYGASFIEWFAEEARRIYGDVIPGHQKDKRILVLKQPIGVVAAITPWNFPNAMITRKAGPAFAAGCAMVLKPAGQTPFSAVALAVLGERAGLPAGLFSVITGSAREIGAEMTASPIVRKLTFTGSTEVGAQLYRQSAPTIKKLGLELGGNAPFIVFDDADLDAAVEGALIAKFRNNGQTCVCANRIYVQDKVYDAFAEKLARAVGGLKTGNGFDEGVILGPLIDGAALKKVEEHVNDAVSKGATVIQGGKPHALGGTFFEATVLANVTQEMAVATEETFGPVAPLFRFTDEADVIAKANDTEFGLASYFFAKDLARVFRVAEALEYGMVGVNTGLISTAEAPFGGVKSSGLGREGSRYGIDDFIEIKYVCLGGVA